MHSHQVGGSKTWEEEVAAFPFEHRINIQTRKTVERLPAKQAFCLVTVRLCRQRPPSNGSIERAESTSPNFNLLKRAPDRVLTFLANNRHLIMRVANRSGRSDGAPKPVKAEDIL
jgi:hypothetical protein